MENIDCLLRGASTSGSGRLNPSPGSGTGPLVPASTVRPGHASGLATRPRAIPKQCVGADHFPIVARGVFAYNNVCSCRYGCGGERPRCAFLYKSGARSHRRRQASDSELHADFRHDPATTSSQRRERAPHIVGESPQARRCGAGRAVFPSVPWTSPPSSEAGRRD